MKTLNLQVVHRFLLKNLLDGEGKKGHALSELNDFFKIIDKINFTEDEIKEYQFKQILVDESDPTKGASLNWQTHKGEGDEKIEIDTLKPFELSDDQGALLKKIIKDKNEAKEFTITELKITDIADQLELKII